MSVTLSELLAGAIITLITAVVSWAAARRKSEADIHRSITQSFQALVNELQEQHERDREELAKILPKLDHLESEVATLTEHVGRLEDMLMQNGLKPPPRPKKVKLAAAQ